MEQDLLKLGIIQFGVFLLLSIIILQITLWFIKYFLSKIYSIEKQNVAYSILSSSIILSVFYLMNGAKTPIISTLRLLENSFEQWSYVFESAKHISIFIVIGLISAFVTCIISIKAAFYFLNRTTKFEALKTNSIGQSIIVSIIMISFCTLLNESVVLFFENFVPYPEMPILLN